MKNFSNVSRTPGAPQGGRTRLGRAAEGRAANGGAPRSGAAGLLREQLASDRCGVDVVHLDAVRAALEALPGENGLGQVAELLGLLSNPTRLKMLLALQPEATEPAAELCVCDLATVAGASKSLTSHQLRLLRTAGLVRQRRAGKLTFYRLAEGPLVSLLADVGRIAREHDGADASAEAAVVQRPAAPRGRGGPHR